MFIDIEMYAFQGYRMTIQCMYAMCSGQSKVVLSSGKRRIPLFWISMSYTTKPCYELQPLLTCKTSQLVPLGTALQYQPFYLSVWVLQSHMTTVLTLCL